MWRAERIDLQATLLHQVLLRILPESAIERFNGYVVALQFPPYLFNGISILALSSL
jgi:hypothetical protein